MEKVGKQLATLTAHPFHKDVLAQNMPQTVSLWMIKTPDAREVIKLQHMYGIKRPVISGVLQWRT